jgi:hypothetical protein
LGEKWTIDVNFNQLYAYAGDGYAKNSPGACVAAYYTEALENLERFVRDYGDDGKSDINTIANTHVLSMEMSTEVRYCGVDLKEGKLRILYNGNELGTNISYGFAELAKAVSESPHPTAAMNLHARNSIKKYEEEIAALHTEITTILAMPALVINPRFEENYAALKACAKPSSTNWDEQLGSTTLSYLQGWKDQLVYQGFKADDMLQEGFQEAISKNEVQVRVVQKLKDGRYKNVYIDDGLFVIEVDVAEWGVNVYETGSNTLDLL